MKTIRRPISILLAILMVVGMFTMVPISAGAAPSDFSSDTKTIFVTDSQGWDSDGVLQAYYWKVETSYPAPDYNKVETVVDGAWVATTYLYDNNMNQSVYGVCIPDDANRVLFNRDNTRQTTDTSNVYDGSWWYIDGNKNCVPVSGDVFDTCEQTDSLSAAFVSSTNGADRYYKLDGNYYFVSPTDGKIYAYNNTSELMVAQVVGGTNDGAQFNTVDAAVTAAGEGGTVKLISDIDSYVFISEDDYNTTLDLNGHTITNTSGSGITLGSAYPGGKTFTIKDTSENQTGAITINKKYAGDGCISDSSGRKVVIEGGTYTSDANALYVSSDEGWTINGGTFNGDIKVVSELDVTGGTINGDINATGPSWTVDPAEVTISGGTVNGSLKSENDSTFAVSGGTFSEAVPENYCAEGYVPKDNGNGTYGVGVVEYELRFDNESYTINCGSTTTVKVSGTKDGVALNNAGYAEVRDRWNLTFTGDQALESTKTSVSGVAVSYTVKGLKVGTYTATLTDSLGLIAPITATVTVRHYASPTLSGTTPRLVENGPYTFTALKFDGETVDLNDYTFTSLDENVATIDGTTITPLKEGSVPVKITSKNDPDATYTYNYAFKNAPVKIGDTYYQSLSKAMTAAADGDTIVVLKDFSETVSYTGTEKTATIDLNGHTITAATDKQYAIRIDRGTWTVKDSSDAQTGGVSYSGDYAFIVSHVAAECESKLILESGTFTGKTSVVQVGTSGGNGNNKKYYGGTLEVQGGTFITVPDTNETYDANGNFKYTLNKLDYNAASYPGGVYSPSEIIVKGGNFYKFDPSNNAAEGAGTDFVPAEYESVFEKNDDDTYTVEKTLAVEAYDANGDLVGKYTTIDAAIEAGGDGCTVKLVADLYEQQQINSQKTPVTLDLNGHMINVQNGAGLNFSMGYYWNGDHIFTIKDTSEEKTGGINITPKYPGNACISDNTGRTIIVEGGTFTSTGKAIYCTGSNGTMTVNGGTFNGDIYVHDTGYGHGTLSITGGTVNGTLSTVDNAVLTVSGGTFDDPVPAKYCAEGYVPKDNGDGTYTVEVKPADLFTGHSITLRGDVSLNFFINTAAIDNYDASVPAKVVFTYDKNRTVEVDLTDATLDSNGVITATIKVPAAFMAHNIHAVVYYNGVAQAQTDDYSIQQYAETLIEHPEYTPAGKNHADLAKLMKEMLNYGKKAQTVFANQVNEQAAYDDLAIKYGYVMTPVTAEKIQFAIDNAPENRGKTASDLSAVKPEENATFYTVSVVFLSESTLKIVFKVPGGSSIAGEYDGSQKNTYYWVQEKDIAAAELDTLQEFSVGDATFRYSALDYAKVVLNSGNAAAVDLVSAMYLYNDAANTFFAD